MAATPSSQPVALQDFLQPLDIDVQKIIALSRKFRTTYSALAAESLNQFLATPISDSILESFCAAKGGRYLAIDIGGTYLRVGFVQLTPNVIGETLSSSEMKNGPILDESRAKSTLEKSWPIGEQLKLENAEELFSWIGDRIAEVVEDGIRVYGNYLSEVLLLGITFSFPMIQTALSDATLMPMGKGFAITSNLDLGKQVREGYLKARGQRNLPGVEIAAIVNDSVATLISFSYQLRGCPLRKAALGLVVGTGSNATIALKLSSLHPTKRPEQSQTTQSGLSDDKRKVVVNTEWSINGTVGPLRELRLITPWDESLDAAGDTPGFQPFEYMTAGRYLGELGRLIIIDYFTRGLGIDMNRLPPKLCRQNGLTTSFLGLLRMTPGKSDIAMAKQLAEELPSSDIENAWHWTAHAAQAVYRIAKAIEVRAAGMIAAAIVGLLACAEEIPPPLVQDSTSSVAASVGETAKELVVGYTGGCIAHFQDYLEDCQMFLDAIIASEFQARPPLRVILHPCQDGGTVGAGILAGAVQHLREMA